jgi:nitronate monooxygenase
MPSNPRYPGDLELVEKYKVPVVLTSKGAPGDAIQRIHGWGAVALHDIANRRMPRRRWRPASTA